MAMPKYILIRNETSFQYIFNYLLTVYNKICVTLKTCIIYQLLRATGMLHLKKMTLFTPQMLQPLWAILRGNTAYI